MSMTTCTSLYCMYILKQVFGELLYDDTVYTSSCIQTLCRCKWFHSFVTKNEVLPFSVFNYFLHKKVLFLCFVMKAYVITSY